MAVTKLTIEIDDGEPVVITAAHPAENVVMQAARLGRWLNEAASDRAEPRTMAADYQTARRIPGWSR